MAGKRHRWKHRMNLDGSPTDPPVYDCRCGCSKRQSLLRDILFRYADGGGVSLWKHENMPPCSGRPEEKKP